MKKKRFLQLTGICFLAIAGLVGLLQAARAQSVDAPVAPQVDVFDGFTYQGTLVQDGAPVNGSCDLIFALYDSLNGGEQIGIAQTFDNRPVSEGQFTAVLNAEGIYGPEAFSGQARWLEIEVRCPAEVGNFVTLNPRQLLRAVPYALSLQPGAVVRGVLDSAVLTLANSGIGNGLDVGAVGGSGVVVGSAGNSGVVVSEAFGDGIYVGYAGQHGLEVSLAEENGLSIYAAGGDGLWICSTGSLAGCETNPGNHGIEVGAAQDAGVYLHSAGSYGYYVGSAGSVGVVVDSAGSYGMYVVSAELAGVVVSSAGSDGVYANTRNAAGEWGLRTLDKISGSNVTALSYTLVAQVAPGAALEPGQVVAALGLGQSLSTSPLPVALIGLASDPSLGLAGVVEARLVFETVVDEEGNEIQRMHSAPGAALPGDYVLLTVAGVAQVLAEPGAVYTPGTRLAVTDGYARPMETRTLDGMLVSEGAPLLGTVLEGIDPETGLLPVFISLR
jgi:hypothetical protein